MCWRSALVAVGVMALGAVAIAMAGVAPTGRATAQTTASAEIRDYWFWPEMITVPLGATVTWTNLDAAAHTVTADQGAFDSGRIAGGDAFTYDAAQSGYFTYLCTIHPEMRGLLRVMTADGTIPARPGGTPAPVPTPRPLPTESTLDASAIVPDDSGWRAGLNSAVVQGSGSAEALAAAAAASSGREVVAIWQLLGGRWLFFLPAYAGIDGGLVGVAGPVASVLVVLA